MSGNSGRISPDEDVRDQWPVGVRGGAQAQAGHDVAVQFDDECQLAAAASTTPTATGGPAWPPWMGPTGTGSASRARSISIDCASSRARISTRDGDVPGRLSRRDRDVLGVPQVAGAAAAVDRHPRRPRCRPHRSHRNRVGTRQDADTGQPGADRGGELDLVPDPRRGGSDDLQLAFGGDRSRPVEGRHGAADREGAEQEAVAEQLCV